MLDKKTEKEIEILREGGKLLGEILRKLSKKVIIGATGNELNKLAEDLIYKTGGEPSFKNYQGFPNTLCVSVNQTVVHGIPNNISFKEGDLVGLDIGMKYKGLYTDTAVTIPVGNINKEVKKLLEATKKSLEIGISKVSSNNYIGDIGKAIEEYVKPFGYGIVRDLCGHGVGRKVHEDPAVLNYNTGEKGDKMFPGLVIAIEPMIIIGGGHKITIGNDNWSVNSKDNSLTAHFEHTIAVTKSGNIVITR